jgi:hypothetical protein
MRNVVLTLAVMGVLAGCGSTTDQGTPHFRSFEFDFANERHGWQSGFADYPVGQEDAMGLESAHAPLPAGLDRTGRGLFIAGTNHSDDLFMFWKSRVTGLLPNGTYHVSFEIEFATDSPSGCAGIGGAPGESVHLKAGAATFQPSPEVQVVGGTNYFRMNVDKGNQSEGGASAGVLGHIGNTASSCTNRVWQIRTLSRQAVASVTADENGEAWIFVGTDSGFEGRTELYYTKIRADLER